MKIRWGRVAGIGAAVLAAVAVLGVLTVDALAARRMNRVIDVPAVDVADRSDAEALRRGGYLYASRGCADCHGGDGAGAVVVDDGKGFLVRAPNITPEAGSAVAGYASADWDRAIRHGVKRDGRPLLLMPSEDYNRLTDEDLAALVAHLRRLAPKRGGEAIVRLPLPLRALYAAGLYPDAASRIDHAAAPSQPVPEGVTVEHGAYVANACKGCHGEHLSGGRVLGGAPDWPPASNLTPGPESVLPRYADGASFAAMLRTGRRPDGSAVSSAMPFGALAAMNDTDIAALHLYLKQLPPRPAGGG